MKNQITFDGGAVVFTRPDGGVYTVPASAVYVVYHDDTATFKLVALPRESGLAIMSTRASDVEVDGQSYSSIDDLKAALNDKFAKAAGGGVSFEVVEELPTSGETNIIYLVPSQDTQGTYDEYIWLEEEGRWELLGSTHIDLSGYVTDEEFSAHTANTSIHVTTALTNEILAISGKVDTNEQITAAALNELNSRFGIIAAELDDKQDVLTAGEGISISGNVISASGQGIVIDSNLDSGSTNAVANSAITAALSGKCDVDGNLSPIASRSRETNYWQIHKVNGGTFLDSGWININGQPVITNGFDEWSSGRIINLELATEADFSGHTADTSIHVTTAQTTAWNAKQDALVAGSGITISGNVISATGGGGGESDVYLVDYAGLYNGNVVMDDELWDELVSAFTANKVFVNSTSMDFYKTPLIVLYDGNDDSQFAMGLDDTNGYKWLYFIKHGAGEYEKTTNYLTNYPYSFNFDEYYYGRSELDEIAWDDLMNNIGTLFTHDEPDDNGVEYVSTLPYSYWTSEDNIEHFLIRKNLDTGGWQKLEIQKVSAEGVDPEFFVIPSSGTDGASQAALDELSGQVQTIDTVVATALNELNEEVSGATGAVSTLSGTVTGLSQSVNSLNGRVSNLEQNKPDVYLVAFKDLFDGTAEFDEALWMDIVNAYDNHSVIMSEPMAGANSTEYQIISVDHPSDTKLILRLTASNDEIVVDLNEGGDPEFEVTTYKGARMRQISQADYNALVTKDPNTLYIINDNV